MIVEKYEFFVYGCKKHVKEFAKAINTRNNGLEVLDRGSLDDLDINYGKDCAFEKVEEGFADSYILVGWFGIRRE